MKTIPAVSLPIAAMLLCAPSYGQRPEQQGQRPPQQSGIDISGDWFSGGNRGDNNAFIQLVDYGGVPLSEAGRLYALTWNPSRMTLRQQQCAQYDPTRLLGGGGNFRFWEERDPDTQVLIAIKMYGQITEGTRTVWMDGRPHPPAYAKHSFLGFSTGKYEGTVFTVYTTHIKRNWIKSNGLTFSNESTIVEHFMRHGDRITYVAIVTDPVYLAEPMVRTWDLLRVTRDPDAWLYACDDGEQILSRAHDPTEVPNYLYGQNPFIHEYADKLKLPLIGVLGGADTMYPEYMSKLRDPAVGDAAINAKLFPTSGPAQEKRAVDPDPHDGEIHVLPVQGNVYMLVGDGGNIAVQVGDQGAFVVDAGAGQLSDKVIAEIRKLSRKPIQYIVNTSFHADHTGGNAKLHAAGEDPSLVGSFFSSQFADAGRGSTIIAQQNVQNRMSAPTGKVSPVPAESWPTDTFVEGRRRKYHNGEGIEIFWLPNASTDGDSIVQFRRSDVIVAGDIFDTTRYPFIDIKNGGTVQGEIAALNSILDKTIYQHEGEGGTLVIPGHGRLCDEYEVSEYRDMLAIVRDRVQGLIKSGASLEQVKKARVTADYDGLYGANSGAWTTDMFVEAVYTSLKGSPVKATAQR